MAAGLEVEVLPGPSAALAALVASGMEAATWRFVGLPAAQEGRAGGGLRARPRCVVAFESPRRVAASLAVLAALDPERPVAVCRELTKLHEEVVRGIGRRSWPRATPRRGRAGEVVLVIGAAQADEVAARARARRAAAAGRRGRGAAAAGGRRGGRAHRDERECAVSRADRHEVAQRLQQVTRATAVDAPSRPYRSAHAPTPAPRRPRLARASGACSCMALVLPRGAAGRRLALAAARAGGRRLSPLAAARRSRAGSAAASTCRRRPAPSCAPPARGA